MPGKCGGVGLSGGKCSQGCAADMRHSVFLSIFTPSAAHVCRGHCTCTSTIWSVMWPLVLLRKVIKRPLERDSAPWWQIQIMPSDSGSIQRRGGYMQRTQKVYSRGMSTVHSHVCSSTTDTRETLMKSIVQRPLSAQGRPYDIVYSLSIKCYKRCY